MGNGHNNDDDDDRKDLTRIEDLSEFLHEEDPDLESKFGDFDQSYHKADGTSTEVTTNGLDLPAVSDLSDLESHTEEAPPEVPFESLESDSEELISMPDLPLESSEGEMSGDFSLSETTSEETSTESDFASDFSSDFSSELSSDFSNESPAEEEAISEPFTTEELPSYEETPEQEAPQELPPERFTEVKTFAQNFSYGQIQGGGNPPYSLIIRNLKYEDDKESILSLLTEFGIVTEQNLDETNQALEMGNLLVPQISEYSAIILAHKLRRFDCDLEMGLSDEVHPSKSGEQNPKGLVKKESLRQNISESYVADSGNSETKDISKEIIVATTAHLEGYKIQKYVGVRTSFAIVDEEELERLAFVQKQERSQNELSEYLSSEEDSLSSEQAFMDYRSSFDYLFVTLAEELKSKAQKEKANALLGLSYQLQPLPFEKTANGKNCYQLTASATMAVVSPEY